MIQATQDIIIFIITILFGIMAIPQIRDSYKGTRFVNPYTSGFTVFGLWIMYFMFHSLSLVLTSTAVAFEAGMYSFVFYYSVVNE